MMGFAVCVMDLTEYIRAAVDRTSIRKVAELAKLASKSPIERILKGESEGFPELETLLGIAEGFGLDLLDVVQMAGATIPPPRTPAEAAQRLGNLVTQVPDLGRLVAELRDIYVHDPSYVSGMIVGLEVSIADWKRRRSDDVGLDRQAGQ